VAGVILPDLGIELREDGHTYFKDGSQMPPGVTTIMRFMSRELYDGIRLSSLDVAAGRGSRVHEQTYYLDTCGYTDVDEDTEPYIDGYKRFLADVNPVWLPGGCEWMGYHKTLMYPGTIDRIGYVTPDDGTGVDILDIKTTRAFHRIMLRTQLSGYEAIVRSWGIPVRSRYGLCLTPEGGSPYHFERLEDGYKTFIHCLALHNEMMQEVRA
jgi:hypothetical protein